MMQHAERFHIPIITLIDTPGAAPDLEAELRGISQAIAENLITMARLATPIVCVVIGEGGSGGALGIGIGDRILMLENAYYTVASPEGAATILWRDAAFAPNAAENMRITAADLHELGLIEGVVPEPVGGAHRDHRGAARFLKEALVSHLDELAALPIETLLARRYDRFRAIGSPAPQVVAAQAVSSPA
jgi:acetyl-CoA carboxylase carboxyl transferase subunit alpha